MHGLCAEPEAAPKEEVGPRNREELGPNYYLMTLWSCALCTSATDAALLVAANHTGSRKEKHVRNAVCVCRLLPAPLPVYEWLQTLL